MGIGMQRVATKPMCGSTLKPVWCWVLFSTFPTLYHCAACEAITLSWKETWQHEKEGSGVQQAAASIQAGVFDCCVFVFIHCLSPWLHTLITGMMDTFWNMNEDDDNNDDDEAYDNDEEEEDLFEEGEEQQSTPLIGSILFNLHACHFHLKN